MWAAFASPINAWLAPACNLDPRGQAGSVTGVAEQRIVPVIMSGGAGTRLWPLSRPASPKQLLPLVGDQTMLQMTALRTAGWSLAGAPVVIGSIQHADAIEAQLAAAGIVPAALILEPVGRNTAAAVASAALAAAPEDLLLVMPSDHLIADAAPFRAAVEAALPLARDGWLVTFGINPTAPETGYGYIRRGDALGPGLFAAAQFIEKPPRAKAEQFLGDGGYSWNAGIFLFRAQAMVDALREHVPDVLAAVAASLGDGPHAGRVALDSQAFARAPSISIDYAVMERADKVAVVPVEIDWSDVGSWDALHALLPRDGDGNAMGGDVIVEDVSNCLIRSDGPVVAALGVSDLIVVATGEAVVILPRGRSQEIRALVDGLKARGHPAA